ncbi:MAG: hypothetical protein KVP17_002410 [Porospora cf. gigantea B]|nr:MAG: hypothetical protein KVP17_002410 [Porospora cf. gigantea B]
MTTTPVLPLRQAFEDLALVCCKSIRLKGLSGHWAPPSTAKSGPIIKTGVTRWGRVVGVVPHANGEHVVVSFLPHIVDMGSVEARIGERCITRGLNLEKLTLCQVDKSFGIYGTVVESGVTTPCFASSKGCKQYKDDWHRSLYVGQSLAARVTGWNPVDGAALVEFPDESLLGFACDLNIGAVVKGTVEEHHDTYLLVAITGTKLKGRVSLLDVADIVPQKIDRMHYHTGKKFKCRIRNIDPDTNHVDLTMKQSEINQEHIVTDISMLTPDALVSGVVSMLKPDRMLVRLFGAVRVMVNAKHLTAASKVGRSFSLGESVSLKILDVKPEEGRAFGTPDVNFEDFDVLDQALGLSLDVSGAGLVSITGSLRVGRVPLDSINVMSVVDAPCGPPVLVLGMPISGRTLVGLMPVGHLSDDRVVVSAADIRNVIRFPSSLVDVANSLGTEVDSLVCLARRVRVADYLNIERDDLYLPLFSAKPSVIDKLSTADVVNPADLEPSASQCAWIRQRMSSGFILAIGRPHISAFMRYSEWKYSDANNFFADFSEGMTVRGRLVIKDDVRVLRPLPTDTGKSKTCLDINKSSSMADQCQEVFEQVGAMVVAGRVRGKFAEELKVQLLSFHKVFARVHVTEITDEWELGTRPLDMVEVNDDVQLRVLGPSSRPRANNQHVYLEASIRPSQIQGSATDSVAFRPLSSSSLSRDQVLSGGVVCSTDYSKGLFVALSRTLTVRVPLFHIKGEWISFEEAEKTCPFGSVVGPIRVTKLEGERATVSLVTNKKQLTCQTEAAVLQSDDEVLDEESDAEQAPQADHLGSDEEEEPSSDEGVVSDAPVEDTEDVQISDAESIPKNRPKKRKNPTLRERATALIASPDHDKLDTVEDYERLLVTKKDASAAWIKYMAHFVQLDQIGKAREVAERSIKTINYREEKERFNIWVAYMNMEAAFGTRHSLEAVSKRAQTYADERKVLDQLIRIHEARGSWDACRQVCKQSVAKFGQEVEPWRRFLEVMLKQAKGETGVGRSQALDEARKVFVQCLRQLPESKHVEITIKYAKLEYGYGSRERGKSLFDALVGSRPKRTDLWLVFLDAHIKHWSPPVVEDDVFRREGVKSIRELFERATSLPLKPFKMVPFYKKWVEFETECGLDPVRVQRKVEMYIKDWEARKED